ncbi:MAG: PTS fructose transporter subunit IIABC [Brevinema sp.]
MKNFFDSNLIHLTSKSSSKRELLTEMADLFTKYGYSDNKDQLLFSLQEREQITPTLISENIAMPHTKDDSVIKPKVMIVRTQKPIIWNASTQETAQLFFMIGIPKNEHNLHLDIISGLSRVLSDDKNLQVLFQSDNKEEIIDLFSHEETFSIQTDYPNNHPVDIVAVTACPSGIAHTYMAADALKKSGQAKGLNIRVETNGSDGAKDMLSEEEIQQAQVVIIASDREVDMARFHGKKLYKTGAGHAVRKPVEVIDNALSETTSIYISQQNTNTSSPQYSTNIYGNLMTGVSYMLPFVVGGGILIALGFIFGITAHDPNASDYNPMAQFLNTLGAAGAFSLMIPVLAGFIGFSIAERPGLMPAMVGGSLAASTGGGFLGGLLAGFVGGYSIVILKKLFAHIPKLFDGLKPVLLYPVFGLLLTGLILIPLLGIVATINNSMTLFLDSLSGTNLILLGLILGGMMAIDLGGPINKAAFTFGIAAIATGNLYPHAAVMAGGMVPPLGVALATTLAKHLFTESEREAGLACYALGASFITEAVIPFAASRPLIIIPACIIGSATAGALSMAFACQLPAPHGGIFVFPLITNLPGYLLSIVVGSIITAILIIIMIRHSQKNKI